MELPKVKKENKVTVSEVFGKFYQFRDTVNIRHLNPTNKGQLGSGWEHKALNDLYDGILDLVDDFIESYQGKYGIINFTIPSSKVENITEYIATFGRFIENDCKSVFKDSWLQNQLDEMSTLIYKSLYKLNNLK